MEAAKTFHDSIAGYSEFFPLPSVVKGCGQADQCPPAWETTSYSRGKEMVTTTHQCCTSDGCSTGRPRGEFPHGGFWFFGLILKPEAPPIRAERDIWTVQTEGNSVIPPSVETPAANGLSCHSQELDQTGRFIRNMSLQCADRQNRCFTVAGESGEHSEL